MAALLAWIQDGAGREREVLARKSLQLSRLKKKKKINTGSFKKYLELKSPGLKY